jgi:hypothetical protein
LIQPMRKATVPLSRGFFFGVSWFDIYRQLL